MLIHAAGESSPGKLPPHTYAIALTQKNEHDLNELSYDLFKASIAHQRIVENDAPYSGQLMALGVKPGWRSELKKHLSSCPLLK
jgi:hypothetical protein